MLFVKDLVLCTSQLRCPPRPDVSGKEVLPRPPHACASLVLHRPCSTQWSEGGELAMGCIHRASLSWKEKPR